MGHDSAVKNPSQIWGGKDSVFNSPGQIWGGDNSVFNQLGDLFSTPTPQGLQAPPAPPTTSMAASGSLQNEVKREQDQFSASTLLTGGQGTSGQPMTASQTLVGR